MVDRENVIKGLECCTIAVKDCGPCPTECPFFTEGDCNTKLMRDAVTLLKEQEPMKHGRWLKGGYVCGETEWICSVCGKTEWRTNCNRMKYCMFCGAKMDLEEVDDG